MENAVILRQCPDQKGIIAKASQFVFRYAGVYAALLLLSTSIARSQPQEPLPDRLLLPGEIDPARLRMMPTPGFPGSTRLSNYQLRNDLGRHPDITRLLEEVTKDEWVDWIEKLSGGRPVIVAGAQTTIRTRYSYAMFTAGRSNAQAYDYVLEQVKAWVPAEQIEEDPFTYNGNTWKNLIVTLPGATRPEEVVILCAHLDSYSNDPWNLAPGAEDNGSGSATLLEAAHWISQHQYQRTIRLIWFTGEEQGLLGSLSYLADHASDNIVGAINLDMFGYDADNDRCFELHVGKMPASDAVGQCFLNAIADYQINLSVDYLTDEASTCCSDHVPFWGHGVGAVFVLENYSANRASNGCGGKIDRNPNYHKTTDTIDKLNVDAGFDIARGAIATAASMAVPLSNPPDSATLVSPSGLVDTHAPSFVWQPVRDSTWYYLWVNDLTGQPVITNWYTASQAGCEQGTGMCSVYPDTNLDVGQHTWWIETWNTGGYGPWSEGMRFEVTGGSLPPAARLISPDGPISTLTPAFAWNAVSGSSWYYVWVNGPSGNPVVRAWYTASLAGCADGAGICTVLSPISLNTGQHSWWIQSWNYSGYSPWSGPLSFTAAAAVIGYLNLRF